MTSTASAWSFRWPSHESLLSASARAFHEAEELPFPAQPLAEATAMFLEQLGDLAGGIRARPVALQLAHIGPGRDRHGARLDHALHRHVVRLAAGAAGCVG